MRASLRQPVNTRAPSAVLAYDLETVAPPMPDGSFPPWPTHVPVAAGFAEARQRGGEWAFDIAALVVSGDTQEADLVLEADRRIATAQVVTSYNGRGFDALVLRLAAQRTLTVRYRFGSLGFDLESHSTTVTDDPHETMTWLAERLHVPPERLLLWRAEDIVVPSLISACDTARDTMAAARLLRELKLTFEGDVIDVAEGYGGSAAKSFDAVAHAAGLPFKPMTCTDLAEAHRTGCHGTIRDHLAARVKAMWWLWLNGRDDSASLIAATDAWLATTGAA